MAARLLLEEEKGHVIKQRRRVVACKITPKKSHKEDE